MTLVIDITSKNIGITTTLLTVGLLLLSSLAAIGASAATPNLTISAKTDTGQALSGYYVTVTNSAGKTIRTGYTTAQFTLRSGTYTVSISDYGGEYFSHWSDGTTTRSHSVTIKSGIKVSLSAVFCSSSSCSSGGGPSTIVVDSAFTTGGALNGMYIILTQSGSTVGSGFTPTSFSVTSGQTYTVSAESYTNAYFNEWSDGVCSSSRSVTASSSQTTLTALYTTTQQTCNGGSSNGITVSAHRIPASYWAPCFALVCSAGTGPGASMYFVLYDASGNIVQTGFADENGYTFTGLTPGATYYVYPADCDLCHGSTHDVLFQYWGNDVSTTRPLAATVGANLEAWYSCTNGCSGP